MRYPRRMEKLMGNSTIKSLLSASLAGIALSACQDMNLESSENCFSKEVVYPTIISVPDSGKINEQLTFDISVNLKNDCGSFGGFLTTSDSLAQKINIESLAAYRGCTCAATEKEIDTAYTFTPSAAGTYQFSFKNGASSFDTKTVIVTE